MDNVASVESPTSPLNGSALAGSDTVEGGSSSESSVGDGLQQVAELSDSVSLSAEVAKAYEGFDPAIHATYADGTPRPKKGGGTGADAWQLKRGRKPGAVAAPTGTVAPQATPKISNDAAAAMLCGMTEASLIMLMGREWETDATEAKALRDATRAYLAASGGLEAEPLTVLLLTYGVYAMPRFTMPETQSRLKKAWTWFASMFHRNK